MPLRICAGGVTGWTGSALAAGILAPADLELAGAVALKAAHDAGAILKREPIGRKQRDTLTD